MLCLQLKEVQNTLELVQGQRNELRQEVKDLKAALADAQAAIEVRGLRHATHCGGMHWCSTYCPATPTASPLILFPHSGFF